MSSDRIEELIAVAALGELTDAEARELESAAERDPAVRRVLDAALGTAAALHGAGATAPPDHLRARVLDAVAATPQDPTTAAVVPIADRRRRRMMLAAGAVAAATIVLVAGGVVLRDQGGGPSDDVVAVVDAPDAVTRVLDGTLGGSLVVISSPSEAALVVEGEGLPTLDDAATYQLWVIGADGPTSAGIFRPDDEGSVLARFDDVVPGEATLGVTREPAGGSTSPTLPILASA
jgi:anti-sigma-K factor RskA